MFDQVARNYYETRDVQWLRRMFWIKYEEVIEDITIEVPEQLDDLVQVEDAVGSQEEQKETDSSSDPKLATIQTRSGRHYKQPAFMQDFETGFFSKAKMNYCRKPMGYWRTIEGHEILAVGTTGVEFNNTAELKPMKYDDAMRQDDWKDWVGAVDAEHGAFLKHQVWETVHGTLFLQMPRRLSCTWAMKQKSNNVKRA